MKPRLLLADDHTLLLEGIRLLLQPEFDLVGSVEDGQALLVAAKTLKPDVILLDISMPRSEWNRRSTQTQEASAFGQVDLSLQCTRTPTTLPKHFGQARWDTS